VHYSVSFGKIPAIKTSVAHITPLNLNFPHLFIVPAYTFFLIKVYPKEPTFVAPFQKLKLYLKIKAVNIKKNKDKINKDSKG